MVQSTERTDDWNVFVPRSTAGFSSGKPAPSASAIRED